MRLRAGPAGVALILAAVLLGAVSGCVQNTQAIDEAYQRGYLDGAASVEQELRDVESAYQLGYQDGLADADAKADEEVCQRCYGLGYNEGYQAAIADG